MATDGNSSDSPILLREQTVWKRWVHPLNLFAALVVGSCIGAGLTALHAQAAKQPLATDSMGANSLDSRPSDVSDDWCSKNCAVDDTGCHYEVTAKAPGPDYDSSKAFYKDPGHECSNTCAPDAEPGSCTSSSGGGYLGVDIKCNQWCSPGFCKGKEAEKCKRWCRPKTTDICAGVNSKNDAQCRGQALFDCKTGWFAPCKLRQALTESSTECVMSKMKKYNPFEFE
eukprot:TRINITY_DN56289_c0_g1_i1.p1 TRINITY_DN56289_c0_g1~~TRINITY_DN56289_c0_g1_i1.p1  ORF type:complete len:256 (-),score=20.92 TRINITY_DN56289_c0_g1_i1:127-807(-)